MTCLWRRFQRIIFPVSLWGRQETFATFSCSRVDYLQTPQTFLCKRFQLRSWRTIYSDALRWMLWRWVLCIGCLKVLWDMLNAVVVLVEEVGWRNVSSYLNERGLYWRFYWKLNYTNAGTLSHKDADTLSFWLLFYFLNYFIGRWALNHVPRAIYFTFLH